MATKKLKKQIRFVQKPGSRMLIIVLCVAVVLSMATVLVFRGLTARAEAEQEALRDQASRLEGENSELQTNIGKLGTLESVIQIARDILGLVFPDTVFIEPEN
jgi:cell division protein FtsL